jgi:hypothetical protein
MDARRVTRASVQQREQRESEKQPRWGAGDAGLMTVQWPENGALTVEWVQELGKALDYASRFLLPTELPNVLPVPVIDSLLMAAHKVRQPLPILVSPNGA